MTEAQLLAKVESEGWVIQRTEIEDPNPDLTRKAILCYKILNGIADQRWFRYFISGDNAYWHEHDPFPPTPAATFTDELNAKIAALVTAGTIKAAYVEKVSDTDKTAIAVAVTTANALKMYHVYKDAGGVLQITEVTGTYPI